MSNMIKSACVSAACVMTAFSLGAVSAAHAQGTTTEVTKPSCPPVDVQANAVGKTNGSGVETPPAQPMERSAILPSAGGDGSAAPSVKQGGTDVVAGVDCPLAPNHPNALKAPGPMPEPSRAPSKG